MTVVYARTDYARRPEFRVLTTIEDTPGGRIVRKRPESPAAWPHVSSIVDKYVRLRDARLPLRLVEPARQGQCVVMPYVTGSSPDAAFFGALCDGDEARLVQIVDEQFERIRSMPVSPANTDELSRYAALLGPPPPEAEYLSLGLVDLTLDNIVETPEGAYLLDYEWLFDFPVPRSIVMGRTLYKCLDRVQPAIAAVASASVRVVELESGFMIPAALYEQYRSVVESLPAVTAAEALLQEFVTGEARAGAIIRSVDPVEVHAGRLRAPDDPRMLASRVADLEAELSIQRDEHAAQIGMLEEAAAAERRETARVEGELQKVLSTRGHRMLEYAWRVRGRVLPHASRRARALGAAARFGLRLVRATQLYDRPSHDQAPNERQPGVDAWMQGSRLLDGFDAPSPGYDVVVFPIIDWSFRRQRPQHLASRFARAGHRVFYVQNSFGPDASVERLQDNMIGVRLPAHDHGTIYSADPRSAVDSFVQSMTSLRWKFDIGHAVCILQFPFWTELAMRLRDALGWTLVYDCLDHHGGWDNVAAHVVDAEPALIREADLVVVTSRALEAEVSGRARRCIRVPNAGDFDHFSRANGRVPSAMETMGGPIVGYYGAISHWFDLELVERLARERPAWNFVLIGETTVDTRRAQRLGNIHLLGEKPYADLPSYLHAFDVCVIPFLRGPLTDATDPVKIYEYLAAGKPVVATPLPELVSLANLIALPTTPQDWLVALDAAVGEESAGRVAARQDFARQNTWDHRFERLVEGVDSAQDTVSVVVVTYNNLELTKACLASVVERTQLPGLELVVVDNASTDGTQQWLRELSDAHSCVKVVLNAENLGFARANNQGIAASRGEYVILLNNDTVVTRGWATGLIRHLKRRRDLGLVGPVTNWIGNEARIDVTYETLDGMPAFAREYVRGHADAMFDIAVLAMFCIAFRRATYDEVGPIDERFGMGMFEDDDYSVRVRERGLRVMCAEDVFVHHVGKASFNKLPTPEYQALFERNRLLFEEKWGRAWVPHVARETRAG